MKLRTLALTLVVLCPLAACKKSASLGAVGKRFAIQIQPSVPSTVRVTPGEGWELNVKYESSLEAKASPSGAPVSLGPKDAKVDMHELTFQVPVQPNQSYAGKLSFAICKPKVTCIPVEESVSWTVAGK